MLDILIICICWQPITIILFIFWANILRPNLICKILSIPTFVPTYQNDVKIMLNISIGLLRHSIFLFICWKYILKAETKMQCLQSIPKMFKEENDSSGQGIRCYIKNFSLSSKNIRLIWNNERKRDINVSQEAKWVFSPSTKLHLKMSSHLGEQQTKVIYINNLAELLKMQEFLLA